MMLMVPCHSSSFHSDSSSGDFFDCDSNAGTLRWNSNSSDGSEGSAGALSSLLADVSMQDGKAKGMEISSSSLQWIRYAASMIIRTAACLQCKRFVPDEKICMLFQARRRAST